MTLEDRQSLRRFKRSNLYMKRTEKGFSQSQLAEIADIPIRAIQAYEQGERDINKAQAGTLLKVAKALTCTIEDLLEDDYMPLEHKQVIESIRNRTQKKDSSK